jgi:hypothetical protein
VLCFEITAFVENRRRALAVVEISVEDIERILNAEYVSEAEAMLANRG